MKNKISKVEPRNAGSYYAIHFFDGSKINFFILSKHSSLSPEERQKLVRSLKSGMIIEYKPIKNGEFPEFSAEIKVIKQEKPDFHAVESDPIRCNKTNNRTSLLIELLKIKREDYFEKATKLIGIAKD